MPQWIIEVETRRLKLILSEDGDVSSGEENLWACNICEDFVLKQDKVVNIFDSKQKTVENKAFTEQEDIKPNETKMNVNETIGSLIENENILVKIAIFNYQVPVKQSEWNEDKTLTIAKELHKRTDIRVAVIVKHNRIE